MLEEVLSSSEGIIDTIMSNLWWIVLALMVIIMIGGFVFDIFEDLFEFVEDHVIPVLGLLLALIVGSIFYINFGLTAALISIGVLIVIAIAAYLYIENSIYYSYDDDDESPSDSSDEDDGFSDEEEFGDDDPHEKKRAVKKPVSSGTGIRMDDIAGLDEAKEAIRIRVILPLQHPEVYAKYNKKTGGGILLYGLPGTGKTMFAQAVATELDAAFYEVKCSDIVSKWYGESEQRIKALFKEARKNKRAVIFFDEFEALGKSRNSSESSDINIVPELLAQIQGFDKSDNTLLLLAATNRPWDIDSALLRPGRFNEKILIPLPDDKARHTIVEKQLHGVPVDSSVSIDDIVRLTDGFNSADVVEFCDQLKNGPILRSIENHSSNESITLDDVRVTARKVRSSVSQEDIVLLQEFEKEVQ